MNKIIAFLSSTRLMAVLFIVFAAAMAIATFIENEYDTDTAKLLIYNAKWFEAIMFVFFINFLGNIKRYQLLKKEKWITLVLHLSFVLILMGDRKSTRLNSSHVRISYAVFCLKKKKK